MQGGHGRTTLRREHPGGLPGDRGRERPVQGCRRGQEWDRHFPCHGSCESLQVPGDRVRKAGWFTAVGVWVRRRLAAWCCVCAHSHLGRSVGTQHSGPVLTWPPLGAGETGRREKARGQEGRQEGCIFSRFDRIIVG